MWRCSLTRFSLTRTIWIVDRYLRVRNRLVVAASRAKCAVCFVGNAEWLTDRTQDLIKRSDPRLARWDLLIQHMRRSGLVGSELPLRCPRHPNDPPLLLSSQKGIPSQRNIFSYADRSRLPRCLLPCDSIMECGMHPCQVGRCHPVSGFEDAHSRARCKVVVDFKCEAQGHANRRKCCKPEPDCEKMVPFSFSRCGHEGVRKCCVPETAFQCQTIVPMVFPKCKHAGTRICCHSPDLQNCAKPCERKLPCGHPCPLRCGDDCSIAAASCKACAEIRRVEEEERKKQVEAAIKAAKAQAKAQARIHREHGGYFRKFLAPSDPSYMEACRIVHQNQQPDHRNPIVVVRVEQVYNAPLQVKFYECQQDMKDPTPAHLYKFHGTDKAGVDGICKDGFRQPDAAKPNMDKKSGGTKLPMCALAACSCCLHPLPAPVACTGPSFTSTASPLSTGTATASILRPIRLRARRRNTRVAATRF